MHGKHLYEYAVIRIVPRVEREEFLNAGVALYCRSKNFLEVRITIDEARLKAFCPAADTDLIRRSLDAFGLVCSGLCPHSPIARLDKASRFRWLTAFRSTMIQTSRVHPGLSGDPVRTLERLHEELVLL